MGSHRTARTATKAHPHADALPNVKTDPREWSIILDNVTTVFHPPPECRVNRAQRICTGWKWCYGSLFAVCASGDVLIRPKVDRKLGDTALYPSTKPHDKPTSITCVLSAFCHPPLKNQYLFCARKEMQSCHRHMMPGRQPGFKLPRYESNV
jgi:hypothetical protein